VILASIIGLLMIEETMISPQEYSEGMSMEEYARVMPGEKYWRERIAQEIEDKCSCSWQCTCGAIDMAFIARGQK